MARRTANPRSARNVVRNRRNAVRQRDALFDRVERRGSNVAVNDANGAEREAPEIAFAMAHVPVRGPRIRDPR